MNLIEIQEKELQKFIQEDPYDDESDEDDDIKKNVPKVYKASIKPKNQNTQPQSILK